MAAARPQPHHFGDKPPVETATRAGQDRSQPPRTLLLVPCPHPRAGGPTCRAHLDPGWGSREPPFAAPRADTELHTAPGSSWHPQTNFGKGAGGGGRSGQRGAREIKTRHGKHQETSVLARALRLLTKRTILFCPQHSGSVVILLPPLLDGFIYSAIAWLWLFRRQAQLPAFAPTALPGPKGAVLRVGAAWGAWPGSFWVPSGLCSTGRRHLEQMLS